MNWPPNPNDPVLASYLNASDPNDAQRYLVELIADLTPKIKNIVRGKLRVSLDATDGSRKNQDALEVLGDINALLLAQLQALKSSPNERTINNFGAYVAVVAYHACYQYLRRINPSRWRLKNKIRYLLTHRPNLALWENNEGELIGGLAGQTRGAAASNWTGDALRACEDLQSLVPSSRGEEIRPENLDRLVTAIFELVGGPLILDDLVSLVADLTGLEDRVVRGSDERYPNLETRRLDELNLTTVMEQRFHLEQLWLEISQLPLRHRVAILLNLRDSQGRGVITLLPLTRVATIREIANVLEFPLEEFANVWNELPWDDKRIAQHLGLTRQQVINLRYSARAKLERQLKGY